MGTDRPPLRQAPDTIALAQVVRASVFGLAVFTLAIGVAWWRTPRASLRRTGSTMEEGPISGVERSLLERRGRGIEARERAQTELSEWRWADEDVGLVRPPIKIAMSLVAAGQRPQGAPPIDDARAPAPGEP
jgi:hypothetical protein